MADININANGCCNSKNFPKTQTSISWHSNKACKVTLSPVPNCFGSVSSITFPPYNQALQVQSTTTTYFTTPCKKRDTYDITFSNRPRKRTQKAPAKKAAKKAPAKKAARRAPAKSKSKTAPKRTK